MELIIKNISYVQTSITNISNKLRMGVKLNAFHSESNDVAMQAMYFANPLFAGMFLKP